MDAHRQGYKGRGVFNKPLQALHKRMPNLHAPNNFCRRKAVFPEEAWVLCLEEGALKHLGPNCLEYIHNVSSNSAPSQRTYRKKEKERYARFRAHARMYAHKRMVDTEKTINQGRHRPLEGPGITAAGANADSPIFHKTRKLLRTTGEHGTSKARP